MGRYHILAGRRLYARLDYQRERRKKDIHNDDDCWMDLISGHKIKV